MTWRRWAAFAALGVLWGSAWILTPVLPLPELCAGAVRFGIAAIVLLLLATLARRRHRSYTFQLVPSLLLGITLVGLPYVLAVWAKGLVSAGLIAVMYSAMPLLAWFLGRRARSVSIPALAFGMGGIALLVDEGTSFSSKQMPGIVLLACSVTLGAFSLNYAKGRINKENVLLSSAMQCAVAAALLSMLTVFTDHGHFSQWNRISLLALLAMALLESAVGLPLLYLILAQTQPWQAAMLQWLATLVAVAEAASFLRARPTFEMTAGAVLTAGCIVWLMRAGTRSDTVTLRITESP
jgi:drug/metabolite transporter (DMT)-like permease